LSSRNVFAAIADPTRREILELLRERGVQTAGEIAASFASVSRPGISRHLRVLRECGVVACVRQGKSQNYVLDSRPLIALRDGWLAGFAQMQSASLKALRKRVESGPRSRPAQRKSR
jgi:DNA-binding transcriptional ArsR family regulator